MTRRCDVCDNLTQYTSSRIRKGKLLCIECDIAISEALEDESILYDGQAEALDYSQEASNALKRYW
jgi:hypothetical protein